MKVKDIMQGQEEFKRLQYMIDDIKEAIKGFTDPPEGEKATTPFTIMLQFEMPLGENSRKITIHNNVTALIKPDVIMILNDKLATLTRQQEALEIN